MPIIAVTDADLRDPMESEQICCAVEGPIDREQDGFCYCYPAKSNAWDDDSSDELSSPHLHLKVWGRNPDAAPRYYEIPFR